MMHDELTPRSGDHAVRRRTPPADTPADAPATPADREVPLPPGAEFAALHAWLDGEVDEMALTNAQTARQREVWRRINEDTAKMRRLASPPFLEQKVMQALAQASVAERTATAAAARVAGQGATLELTWPIATGVALACALLGAALVALLG
ncbi:MAG: hypothetical protein ACK53A_03405 [Gemmatimonadota bacterium]|jgi:hypothetical protein|nr:hypothetical protein [Gemmatimonadota bacterium]